MQQLDLTVAGMSCTHCVRRVTQALQHLPGVTIHDVQIGAVRLAYAPETTSLDTIRRALSDAGYAVGDARPAEHP